MSNPNPAHHVKMVDRVAKLLRQAEDAERAGRHGERIAFQEKAFAIMAQYGIDEALARARQDGLDVKIDPKAESIFVHLHGAYQPQQWTVLDGMAGAMHCKTMRTRVEGRTAIRIYGMPDHLRRVEDMSKLLQPQALHGVANARPLDEWCSGSRVRVYRRNWLEGYSDEISGRIRKAENQAAASAGAVVLYRSDKERAELAMNRDYPDLTYTSNRRVFDYDGYEQGCQAGQSAQLHRSVTA